ncbi:hypothetical protein RD792_003813 [Penstemon davidsonii]|uniref:Cyclin C-terminal domain-containing protein n=1 Tax=Penstemon davidsonii TaxID=160366 RepID=A0ABR0DFQ6_9LAMI|nr:hypothetical protein RD792_003813 [Penstemon davidsonii]
MTTPTTWCFVVRYLSVVARHDQGGDDGSFDDLECVARFITWLFLFSDSVRYKLPSTIAASSVFLASYILVPIVTGLSFPKASRAALSPETPPAIISAPLSELAKSASHSSRRRCLEGG